MASPYRRLGTLGDGGYVVWVGDGDIIKGMCDLYISAGVGSEESFTWDFLHMIGVGMGSRSSRVGVWAWAFDGTVPAFPARYIPKGHKVCFVQRNIGPEMTPTTVNLHKLISQNREIFLKMDIEGGEYTWLVGLSDDQMGRFLEIVVEFHDINMPTTGELFSTVWEKVQRTHWIVHIHGNNYGGVRASDGRPNVIEVTLVRKGVDDAIKWGWKHISERDIQIQPIAGLDWPNCPGTADLVFPRAASSSSS